MTKTFVLTLLMALAARAHDGDEHGPVSIATGKYGGLISNIIAQSDIEFHPTAQVLGKAELVRSGDGTTRVYIYDVKLKKVALDALAPKGYAIVSSRKGTKTKFVLERAKKAFIGQLPKVMPPYTVEVFFKNKETEIYAEFENLD